MTTINYNGRKYNAETVSGYYDSEVIAKMNCYTDDAQEFFDAYIEADPRFVDLFEYDLTPID